MYNNGYSVRHFKDNMLYKFHFALIALAYLIRLSFELTELKAI